MNLAVLFYSAVASYMLNLGFRKKPAGAARYLKDKTAFFSPWVVNGIYPRDVR